MAAEDSSVVAAVPAATERVRPARPPLQDRRRDHAFTVVELLIVIAIILVLAGLILATSGYVQKKGQRSRAEAEIAAISAALENYKADNGIYPSGADTNALDARVDASPSASPFPNVYQRASRFLYGELSGDRNFNNTIDTTEQQNKGYFAFKPQLLEGTKDSSGNITTVSFLRDPFGNSYGYSTAYQSDPTKGYNPTFDLWSTGKETDSSRWIKNW